MGKNLLTLGISATLVFGPYPCFSQQPSASPAVPLDESSAAIATSVAQVKPHTLLDGTPIHLRLGRTISSADSKVGDQVDFEALEDLSVEGVVVIPKGSLAMATVTSAEHKKSMGRAGHLNVNIDSVRLADGEKAALRATEGGKAGGHVGAMTGAIVATSIVFFPAAPLFLFIHGKDLTIPKGTEITAYTNGDMTLQMSRFVPASAQLAASAVASSETTKINISSIPAGADIEINGNFVGNTPSGIEVSPGIQQLRITKKGFHEWNRQIKVTAGSINVEAEMEAESTAAAN